MKSVVKKVLIFFVLYGLFFELQAGVLSDQVVPIKWKNKNVALLKGEFEREVIYLLQNTNKYTLNTWYKDIKKFDNQTNEYLDFGGKTEHFIRPVSHEAFVLAISLRLNVYNPDIVGVSREEAIEKTVKLINSLAYRHKVNSGKEGWGDMWQSAFWASQVGTAGWMMWEFLTPEQREMVCKMMVHEADRFIAYKTPYYRNRQGEIIYKGDSKAEENAWNSNILALVTAMMPKHEHWKQWMRKGIELQLSAYAAPSDLKNNRKINGFRLNKILQGSNIEENGLVINHGIVHPDYMCAIMQNAINVLIYGLAGMKAPKAALLNGDKVYYALTDLDFAGKTIYMKNEKGDASSLLFFPEGNDWGEGRQDSYWMMDMFAYAYKWDKHSCIKALDWAKVRNKKMLDMQGRFQTGQYYGALTENSFKSREEWYAAQIAFGYLMLWENTHGMIRFTNKSYGVNFSL